MAKPHCTDTFALDGNDSCDTLAPLVRTDPYGLVF